MSALCLTAVGEEYLFQNPSGGDLADLSNWKTATGGACPGFVYGPDHSLKTSGAGPYAFTQSGDIACRIFQNKARVSAETWDLCGNTARIYGQLNMYSDNLVISNGTVAVAGLGVGNSFLNYGQMTVTGPGTVVTVGASGVNLAFEQNKACATFRDGARFASEVEAKVPAPGGRVVVDNAAFSALKLLLNGSGSTFEVRGRSQVSLGSRIAFEAGKNARMKIDVAPGSDAAPVVFNCSNDTEDQSFSNAAGVEVTADTLGSWWGTALGRTIPLMKMADGSARKITGLTDGKVTLPDGFTLVKTDREVAVRLDAVPGRLNFHVVSNGTAVTGRAVVDTACVTGDTLPFDGRTLRVTAVKGVAASADPLDCDPWFWQNGKAGEEIELMTFSGAGKRFDWTGVTFDVAPEFEIVTNDTRFAVRVLPKRDLQFCNTSGGDLADAANYVYTNTATAAAARDLNGTAAIYFGDDFSVRGTVTLSRDLKVESLRVYDFSHSGTLQFDLGGHTLELAGEGIFHGGVGVGIRNGTVLCSQTQGRWLLSGTPQQWKWFSVRPYQFVANVTLSGNLLFKKLDNGMPFYISNGSNRTIALRDQAVLDLDGAITWPPDNANNVKVALYDQSRLVTRSSGFPVRGRNARVEVYDDAVMQARKFHLEGTGMRFVVSNATLQVAADISQDPKAEAYTIDLMGAHPVFSVAADLKTTVPLALTFTLTDGPFADAPVQTGEDFVFTAGSLDVVIPADRAQECLNVSIPLVRVAAGKTITLAGGVPLRASKGGAKFRLNDDATELSVMIPSGLAIIFR